MKELIEKYNCFPIIYSNKLLVHSEKEKKNILKLSLTKSCEWKHEQEWRIISIDKTCSNQRGKYIENFPSPIEIFVGCKQIDADSKHASLGDIMDYADREYISLYLSMISRTEYKLIGKSIILNK